MYDYLCSCLPWGQEIVRRGVERVVGYLNSNHMNQQILEEEKCVDDYQEKQDDPVSVYEINKTKSYKPVEEDDDHSPQKPQAEDEDQQDVEPQNRQERLLRTAKIAMGSLRKQLMVPVEEDFERLYDSEDELQLKIYYRLKLSAESRRLCLYRFTYSLNLTLEQYEKLTNDGTFDQADSNLSQCKVLEELGNDLALCYSQYKKVLVVVPRDFVYLRLKQKTETQYIVVSVSSAEDNEKIQQQPETVRGKIILAGTAATIQSGQLLIHSYLQVDLNLNINPLMIKQPAVRQIRKYVQKLSELVKKLKSSNPQEKQQNKLAGLANEALLLDVAQGI